MDAETPDDASLYDTWFPRLRAIAVDRFGIAGEDADRLAHDVLLSSLAVKERTRSGEWLKAAMISASRWYARRKP